MRDTIFQTKELTIGYNTQDPILSGMNFSVKEGEIVAMTGPNGAGKSTFLKTLCRFMKPISGRIDYHQSKQQFSMVPQFKNLQMNYPLNVEEVLRLPGEAKKLFGKYKFSAKDEEIMEKTGVNSFRKNLIRECSGGQIQKVLICRSLISGANLMILDEPLDALDANSQKEMFQLFQEKTKERVSFFIITHNITEGWLSNFHKILKIENGIVHSI
jgi:zinc transport system ATP-binding protein